MEIFEILILCIVSAVLALVIGSYKKEYAFVISVALAVIVFIKVLKGLIPPVSNLFYAMEKAGIKSRYYFTAIKILAIGYVTSFAADTCRDFGQTSMAAKAELAGKAAIFTVSLPILYELFGIITQLLG